MRSRVLGVVVLVTLVAACGGDDAVTANPSIATTATTMVPTTTTVATSEPVTTVAVETTRSPPRTTSQADAIERDAETLRDFLYLVSRQPGGLDYLCDPYRSDPGAAFVKTIDDVRLRRI